VHMESVPVCGELFLLQFIAFCHGWLRFCFGGIGILLGWSLRRHPNDNQAHTRETVQSWFPSSYEKNYFA
jgi:hypothetical protein